MHDKFQSIFSELLQRRTLMKNHIISYLDIHYDKSPKDADPVMLYNAVSDAAVRKIKDSWSENMDRPEKKVCYFSAEFLTGRMIYNNLYNLGLLDECEEFLKENGHTLSDFECIEDIALGNGGLGRLASCFLDSAATHEIPLNGYGIRYRYGIFKQNFENGFQCEAPDDWTRFGDPWSIRRDEYTEIIKFGTHTVKAVPYDMPVIGYGGKKINTLRLWQAEPLEQFDLTAFNEQRFNDAFNERNNAEKISAVLYPNDNGYEGKVLRLKQQYFFSSASVQSIIRNFVMVHKDDFDNFDKYYAIQLNDTHPIVSIPEFMRILISEYNISVTKTFEIASRVFSYTNHTIMAEAMEKWDISLFRDTLPELYPYVVMLNNKLLQTLKQLGISDTSKYEIIADNMIHMARLGSFVCHSINGVAELHTDILKRHVLSEWYEIYPERFNNKTNGITQRRWLALCNKELAEFITDKIGDKWLTDLDELKKLEQFKDDPKVLRKFYEIKQTKKKQLCDYIEKNEGITLSPEFIFDIQIKRLHEYKRQLMNILSVLDIYYCIKDGTVTDFHPTVFLFGAKSAPGYRRAKAIIKLINEVASMINNDCSVNDKLKVLFVKNYNVSYAEKLIPSADISEQISTAGTEASGTGNMKFMLNGAVTLGTLDGANIEIVNQAGQENNYIFGAKVEELEKMQSNYNPMKIYNENPRIKRVLDTLVNGTLSDNSTGMFRELYDSLLNNNNSGHPDQYFILHDFMDYTNTRLTANADYKDKDRFIRKCFMNTANAGKFSSDRTIKQYAEDIWGV